jgi:hypothetical protein
MSEEREFVFDPINFEELAKNGAQYYSAKVLELKQGTKKNPVEETGFMYHQYTQFAPKEIKMKTNTITIESKDRNWMNVPIYPAQQACLEVEKQVNSYDDALAENHELLFDKYSVMYTHNRSIKKPKELDAMEMAALDPNKPKERLNKFRLKMDMVWNYYYENEKLDVKNTSDVRKIVSGALKANMSKDMLPSLPIKLKMRDSDGNEIERNLFMRDLDQRKDICTKVFYRTVEADDNRKKVEDCTEEELVELYGKGELQDVSSPEDLDKYYRHGSYIRLIYSPLKLLVALKKDPKTLQRNYSFQFVCKSIDIIHVKSEFGSSNSSAKYASYAFGKNKSSQMTTEKHTTVDHVDHVESDKQVCSDEKSVVYEKTEVNETETEVNETDTEEEEEEVKVVNVKPVKKTPVKSTPTSTSTKTKKNT